MKYSVYVRNEKEGPSCYYRVMQYLQEMDEDVQEKTMVHNSMSISMFRANMRCKNGYIKKILQIFLYIGMLLRVIRFVKEDLRRKVDVVVVSRETLPRYTPWYLKKLLEKLYQNTVLIWDFDDDIFAGGEISAREAVLLKKYSSHILVTGEYLKCLLTEEEQKKTEILPTTDGGFRNWDIGISIKKRARILDKEVRIVWIGTASNLKNLETVIGELEDFAQYLKKEQKKRVVLTVVCNQKLEKRTGCLKIRNIGWTRQRAEKAVKSSHIGIMPLLENQYNLGKGGFKLIQYMAAGLPVVASAVGYNLKVVKEGYGRLVETNSRGWSNALMELISSGETWERSADAAYKAWKKEFNYQKNFSVWQELLERQFEQKIEYSIIIVNWNSGEQVKKCLDSMTNTEGKHYQIKKVVIVDNASEDGSADFDKDGYPFVCEIVRNAQNMGFAHACNQGSRLCEGGTGYFLFLNPDTMLQKDTLPRLSRYLLRKPAHIGITGIQLFDQHGHISRTCSHFPNKIRRLCKIMGITRFIPSADVIMEGWDHKTSRQVDQVMGAFFVISKELFKQLGGFDERFFVYYEEVDLSRRAKNAGYDSYFYAGAKAFHKGGGTSEQVLDKRLFYVLDSYLKYEEKHNGRKGFLLGCGLVGMEYFARMALLLAKGKKESVKYLNCAYKELIESRKNNSWKYDGGRI